MTRNELLALVAGTLSTLCEAPGHSCPESSLYLVVGMDMQKWETLRNVLVGAKYVTISGHLVTATDLGIETGKKCDEALAKAS